MEDEILKKFRSSSSPLIVKLRGLIPRCRSRKRARVATNLRKIQVVFRDVESVTEIVPN